MRGRIHACLQSLFFLFPYRKFPLCIKARFASSYNMRGQTKAAVYSPEFPSEQVKDLILSILVKEVADPPAVSTWLKKR